MCIYYTKLEHALIKTTELIMNGLTYLGDCQKLAAWSLAHWMMEQCGILLQSEFSEPGGNGDLEEWDNHC